MTDARHVLLCTLGPVQDFIHTARRCQDLWFGSWLLSELSMTAASVVEQASDDEALIFPGALSKGGGGVANRILAVLPAGVDPEALADAADRAQRARLTEIAERVFEGLPPRYFHRDVAMAQIAELMEWNWVAAPITGTYDQARAVAESWMAARKAQKSWTQPTWNQGRGVPKSSLDGERESVIDEAAFTELGEEKRREHFGSKSKERLCGIGLLKRLGAIDDGDWFGEGAPRFHSTAHVAMGALLQRAERAPAAVSIYLRALRHHGVDLEQHRVGHTRALRDEGRGYDAGLLLEGRLMESLEDSSSTQARGARDAHAALMSSLFGGRHEPCPYYAFLIADGDRMGAAIQGLGASKDPIAAHRALSDALKTFADRCKQTVESDDHRGSLIFAGGDDVVALLPLHTALACARRLADDFAAAMRKVMAENASTGEKPIEVPTLSVGLGITHCLVDMAEARRLAKEAEKAAKQTRNALGIVVSKRSGADLKVAGSWMADPPLDARLALWAAALTDGAISRKTSHDLLAVAEHFAHVGAGPHEDPAPREVAALYAYTRKAKRIAGGKRALDQAVRARLDEAVFGPGGEQAPDESILERLSRVALEIQVADLFSRAAADAGARP